MFPENLVKQQEEVAALASIYEDEWSQEGGSTYSIKIEANGHVVVLSITMPPEYPSQSPPTFDFSAPWMSRKEKTQLHHALNNVYLEHVGEPVIYQWAEKIREALLSKPPANAKSGNGRKQRSPRTAVEEKGTCPVITHGEVIVDRKSSFQGHAAEVHSIEEVNAVLAELKKNKKIANAKHNMFAYRIEQMTPQGPKILQDYDDDGEAHAADRLMKLFRNLDQKNTLVVVTRWYGGIQLGPDRFRHINNAARQVIEQAGLLKKK